jgi:DNA-binding response OmpR family regulator
MRHRLLVVDDDAGVRESMRNYLQGRSYDVDCAAGVGEARDLLARSRYEAVVTDLQLTASEGAEGLAVVVEARRRWPGTRVILMTGHPSDTIALAARRLGVDVLVQKPKRMPELEAVIHALVGEAA